MTLFILYAVLGLVLITLVEFDLLPAEGALAIGISIAVAQFLFGPTLMDWSLRRFYTMNWVKPDELPEHLQKFVKGVCEQSKFIPRITPGLSLPRVSWISLMKKRSRPSWLTRSVMPSTGICFS
jgi:hypothetical protein